MDLADRQFRICEMRRCLQLNIRSTATEVAERSKVRTVVKTETSYNR
jgi:hypothetical protein